MVDQSTGNKQISVGRFAVDTVSRRTFLKTYDEKGYTHVLRLYNQVGAHITRNTLESFLLYLDKQGRIRKFWKGGHLID